MKFLIIGLGSMGKRRIRNLKALGYSDIIGFDIKSARRKEAEDIYGIDTVSSLNNIAYFDAVIISAPPDKHNEYIRLSIERQKSCFVELSLVIQDLPELNELAKTNKVVVAPSCTFRFHPAIKFIKQVVKDGKYGKVTNFSYHSGQFLPDWHPWESIEDFFVSKKETSGCKELLSFELHWMIDILGKPEEIFGYSGKTFGFNIDTDDTYAVGLKYNNFMGILLIDVVSRFATRNFILNLEKAQIRWSWENREVKLYDAGDRRWTSFFEPSGQGEFGYNENIVEDMYIEELKAFIDAINGVEDFPVTLAEDIEILKIVENCEKYMHSQRV